MQQISHVGHVVSDLSRSVEFYVRLGGRVALEGEFGGPETSRGLGLEDAQARCAMIELGQVLIELIEYERPAPRPFDRANSDIGVAHIGIQVDDIDALHRELRDAGVEFYSDPILIQEGVFAGGSWCYCKDPDGLTVEFQQPGPALRALYEGGRAAGAGDSGRSVTENG